MPTIGDNIARHRRRRSITQEALAERSGISVETIRKLEQNERTSARMATLGAIARALQTTTSTLMGDASAAAAHREPDSDQAPLLDLRAILTPPRGLNGPISAFRSVASPPDLSNLRTKIQYADTAYHNDDYATTLAILPDLLRDVTMTVDTIGDAQRPAALILSAATHQLAGTALIQLRAFDLAYPALDKALGAAATAGDELAGASAVVTMCWLFLRQGRLVEAEQLAIRTADQIEPRFSRRDPARLAIWGWLLLRAAAAAIRDGRSDDAEDLLDAAAAAAARIGDRVLPSDLSPGPVSIGAFCPGTVAMKKVETITLAGDAPRALDLADQIHAGGRPTSNNFNRFRLDVAHAHAQLGAYVDSTSALMEVRRDAPMWLRHQRYARDIVRVIASARRRALTRELAELADMVGVDI